jgi:N-acetylglucosamine malate deacetylase 1
LKCFKSQFYDPTSSEPDSPISGPEFFSVLEGRGREVGRLIGSAFGEGFTCARPPAIHDLMTLR